MHRTVSTPLFAEFTAINEGRILVNLDMVTNIRAEGEGETTLYLRTGDLIVVTETMEEIERHIVGSVVGVPRSVRSAATPEGEHHELMQDGVQIPTSF